MCHLKNDAFELEQNIAMLNSHRKTIRKEGRGQGSGIDTIKHLTWPRIPIGKWQQQVTTRRQQTDAHASITKQDRNNINDTQKKHRLGMVSKNILLKGLNRFNGAPTSPLGQMWIKTQRCLGCMENP